MMRKGHCQSEALARIGWKCNIYIYRCMKTESYTYLCECETNISYVKVSETMYDSFKLQIHNEIWTPCIGTFIVATGAI